MGFENRIFISAEQFTMNRLNPFSGGQQATSMRSSKPTAVILLENGSTPPALTVLRDLSSSGGAAKQKPLAQSREQSPRGGHGDSSLRSTPTSFEPIPLRDFQQGSLRDLIMRFNCLGYCILYIKGLMSIDHMTPAQGATCKRAQVIFTLEQFKRDEKFHGTDVFHFIAGKLIKQLAVLGDKHIFSELELLFFVCQATANQTCIEKFKESFMHQMSKTCSSIDQIFWLLCWICVMTMSDAPYNPELYNHFFRWFEAMINGDESPEDVPDYVARIVEDMQARVQAAFDALPEDPRSTPQQINEACAKLCIDPPSLDEDGDQDGDNASVGGQSAASSVFSVGGTRHNPMDRFDEGIETISQLLQSHKQSHHLFREMTAQQLERLIRGLLRRMTRRRKGNRSLRSFNRILCEKLLEIVNRHGSDYKLNLSEIVLKVIQATGILDIGLRLWELVSHERNNSKIVYSALFAALIMMRLGNHTMLRNQAVVDLIFDSAFSCCDSDIPQSADFPEHFAVILQSAIDSASKEVGDALSGTWQVPRYLSDAISKRSSSRKPAPKHASAQGGGAAAPKHESAQGGGAAAPPKKPSPKDNAVDEDLAALLRQQEELTARIAASKNASGRK
jgi:hypothetical protein